MGKQKIAEIDVEVEKMRKRLWEKGIRITWFWKSYGEEITIVCYPEGKEEAKGGDCDIKTPMVSLQSEEIEEELECLHAGISGKYRESDIEDWGESDEPRK